MNNQYLIDWSKWNVKHATVSNDVDIHAPSKCLMLACADGCKGHVVTTGPLQPGCVPYVYSGTQRHGAMLQHILDRAASKHPRKTRRFKSHR